MVQTVFETKLLEFKDIVKSKSNSQNRKPDRNSRKLLLYLFTGTRGGHTRLKIIMNLEAILGGDFVKLLTTSIKTSNKKILELYSFQYPSYKEGIESIISKIK